jgi:isopentenyl-diphosphate delta-isomerase
MDPKLWVGKFEERKREHIRHALDPAHQASSESGLPQIHLVHEALPDLDFSEISLETPCFGRTTPTPFYVAGMTAGHADAPRLNRILALACESRGWAMGVGSQRRELEGGTHAQAGSPDSWPELRNEVPKLALFANIGISQIARSSASQLALLVEGMGAQALVVHANALQETLQPEGTPQFKGALPALAKIRENFPFPIILKETGCGFSSSTLKRISSLDLAAVDVSGLGGTHWGRIEGARAEKNSLFAAAAVTFANWGESTVDSVLAARAHLSSKTEVWASGGVRSGLDAAKLLALGADRVGYAKPALEAAMEGREALLKWMETQEFELKVALFCTGARTPTEIRRKEGVWRKRVI